MEPAVWYRLAADGVLLLHVLFVLFVVAGLLLTYGPKVPFLGRLPGDFVVKREHFTFYFPLATCLVLSILLTLLLRMFGK